MYIKNYLLIFGYELSVILHLQYYLINFYVYLLSPTYTAFPYALSINRLQEHSMKYLSIKIFPRCLLLHAPYNRHFKPSEDNEYTNALKNLIRLIIRHTGLYWVLKLERFTYFKGVCYSKEKYGKSPAPKTSACWSMCVFFCVILAPDVGVVSMNVNKTFSS
jgi:hypothetical protein